MTNALISGAGGSAWYWHRVAPLLPDAIDLPADDDSADLTTYADRVVEAVSGVSVASRVPTASIVLVNPMVPVAGESPGKWWGATGHDRVVPAFDPVEDFFHDVPEVVREEAFRQGEPRQSDTPFGQPWPLDHPPQGGGPPACEGSAPRPTCRPG